MNKKQIALIGALAVGGIVLFKGTKAEDEDFGVGGANATQQFADEKVGDIIYNISLPEQKLYDVPTAFDEPKTKKKIIKETEIIKPDVSTVGINKTLSSKSYMDFVSTLPKPTTKKEAVLTPIEAGGVFPVSPVLKLGYPQIFDSLKESKKEPTQFEKFVTTKKQSVLESK